MQAPSNNLRETIGRRASEITDEDGLEVLLDDILIAVQNAASVGMPAPTDQEELAVVDAWASLASDAVAKFYAPASPWPRNVAGWTARAAARLRAIAQTLSGVLTRLGPGLGAKGSSIGVSFPWGIQISLSW